MNHKKQSLFVSAMIALSSSLPTVAQQLPVAPEDTLQQLATLAPPPLDTTAWRPTITDWHDLHMLARPKGNRVVLRWAPDGYVAWRYLCNYGYNLVRIEYGDDGMSAVDTLAMELRPMKLEAMKQHFEATDSLAGAAATLLYQKAKAEPLSSIATVVQQYEDQESRYSYAMLLADLRFDLAEAMALGFVDRKVKRGAHYEYVLHPVVPDSILPVHAEAYELINEPEALPDYCPVISDSVVDAKTISIRWPNDTYTAYDIEMRQQGGEWTKLNNRPYMPLSAMEEPGYDANHYDAMGLEPGTYDFRIRAFDAFGDTTSYSGIHTATLPDLVPPSPARLRYFEIDRSEEPKIFANIHWVKDVIEEDFLGYDIYYYHETLGDEWRRINTSVIAPTDTTYRGEVSGLSSGYVVVMAIDSMGNASASTPQELHITDLVPPSAPTGLSHKQSPTGKVTISWAPNPENDVRYYELFAANAPDHTFLPVPGTLTRDTLAQDSLEVYGVNERYRYYRVRAYDYAGNRSEMSEIYRVEYLNYKAPEACRIDSVWQEEKHVYMRWFKAQNVDVKMYRLFRKLDSATEWTLIRTIDPESIDGNFILIDDEADFVVDDMLVYAMETVNFTGMTSGLSMPVRLKHWGPAIRDIAVELKGKYLTDQKCVELSWTVPGDCPDDYYLVVSSDRGKSGDDAPFRRILSVSSDQNTCRVHWLKRGETARFYVEIYWRDRSRGVPSNMVTITNPYAKMPNENEK